ncbi:MAG: glycosyltransferase [Acidobacteria bacterium]|nr:glycosyltransferase [Acidobacteriota bacterium]
MAIRFTRETPSTAYQWHGESRLFVRAGADDAFAYSEGDATEDTLLAIVREAADVSLHSPELAAAISDWPTRYHLSAARAHLLRPLAPLLRGTTLEIGAGCGALTRYLGELGGRVVALEGSSRRASITAARCRDLANVAVYHDRLERFGLGTRFSAVTLVGVVEWASRFGQGPDAARELIAQAAAHLDDTGVLIVAIENQLGLKYLAGWPEDHLGSVMTGVNDGYAANDPRTFGLGELAALVADAGLPHHAVFAPFPDYKLPRVIVSPAGLDHRAWAEDLAALVSSTPVADEQAPPLPLFSLEQALTLAARNGVLRGLSNSFLLVASRAPRKVVDRHVLAWHYSGTRRAGWARETRFRATPEGVAVEREPLVRQAPLPTTTDGTAHHELTTPFQHGELWTQQLAPVLNRPGWTTADVVAWARPWRDALQRAAGLRHPAAAAHVPSTLVDATPFNLLRQDDAFTFFDLEWAPTWKVEYGFVVFRGVYWSLSRFRSVATPADGVPMRLADLAAEVAAGLGVAIPADDVRRYLTLEADLQQDTTGMAPESIVDGLERLRLEPRPSVTDLLGLRTRAEAAERAVHDGEAALARVRSEHEANLHRLHAERDDALARVEDGARTAEQIRAQLDDVVAARARIEQAQVEAIAERDALRQQVSQAESALAQAESARATREAEHEQALLESRAAVEADYMRHLAAAQVALQQAIDERDHQTSAHNALMASREVLQREQDALLARLTRADAQLRDRDQERTTLLQQHDADLRRQHALLDDERAVVDRERRDTATRAATRLLPHVQPRWMGERARQRLIESDVPLAWARLHPLHFVRGLVRLRRREFRLRVAQLTLSGLFDRAHYQAASQAPPDTPLTTHFLTRGDMAGFSSHPLFDPVWYRAVHADVGPGEAPLRHYIRQGGWDLRAPHPLFDPRFYLSQWPEDATRQALTPLSHFVFTADLGTASPHPLFDVAHYRAQVPHLPEGVNPLAHYLGSACPNADPHPLFSARFYRQTYADAGTMPPLDHYARRGASEDRLPHPLFNPAFYIGQAGEASRGRALEHYVTAKPGTWHDPHPLFDTAGYLAQMPHLREARITPLAHFLTIGWREGLRPNAWFDPRWYLERYVDVVGNPLEHFALHGWREGRDPSPDFSVTCYLDTYRDVARAGFNPLAHYMRHGRAEGRLPRPSAEASPAPAPPIRVIGAAATAPTLVCLSHVSPYPVGAGNEYRLARLLDHLRTQYRIVFILAPLPGEEPAPGVFDELVRRYGNVVLCDRSGLVEYRLHDVPDVLRGLAGQSPAPRRSEPGPDLAYCHDTAATVTTMMAEALGSCALLVEYIFMTRVFPALPERVLKIVDTIDVFSQKGSNVIAYGIGDAETPAVEEARLLKRADLVVAIHPADGEALQRLAPDRDVIVAGVDADVRADDGWPAAPVVFLPGSGNRLNVAGVRDFLKFAWPRVRAAIPTAELRVAGRVSAAVPPGVPGVHRLGHVADLAPEYARARAVINPAVAGTGLKIKTVEALAHLRPVIGWPHNRDGIDASLNAFVHEASDWSDFADAVITAIRRDATPFTADARARVADALSANEAYGVLDARLRQFFATPR